jgi:hypothetical protein
MGLTQKSDQGYLGPRPTKDTYRYNRIGDRVEETRTVTVYDFTLGDVEDPEIYAAEPLLKWQHSEAGQWVMENAVETPSWHRMADPMTYGTRFVIRAKLQGAKLTEWLLRYGNKKYNNV